MITPPYSRQASTFSEAMNESLNDAKDEFKEDKADMAAAATKVFYLYTYLYINK
jgi:hypothetical protein